jgi:hypothetical protein
MTFTIFFFIASIAGINVGHWFYAMAKDTHDGQFAEDYERRYQRLQRHPSAKESMSRHEFPDSIVYTHTSDDGDGPVAKVRSFGLDGRNLASPPRMSIYIATWWAAAMILTAGVYETRARSHAASPDGAASQAFGKSKPISR